MEATPCWPEAKPDYSVDANPTSQSAVGPTGTATRLPVPVCIVSRGEAHGEDDGGGRTVESLLVRVPGTT